MVVNYLHDTVKYLHEAVNYLHDAVNYLHEAVNYLHDAVNYLHDAVYYFTGDRCAWNSLRPIYKESIDMEFYNAVFLNGTVTVYIDSHEVVYNFDKNRRFL
jgi:hypothetical protein